MLQGEHSAILSTFIKLPVDRQLSLRIFFCLFLSGSFTQVLLYLCEKCKAQVELKDLDLGIILRQRIHVCFTGLIMWRVLVV